MIRSLAPPDTLGGGVVLDPDPPRHGPSRDLLARLARLERGEPDDEPEPAAPEPPPRPEPAPLTPAALELEQRLRAAGHEPPARRRARTSSPRCASTAASPASAATCTSTATRSPTSPPRVTELIQRDGSITIATLRDELQTSRRYAQALLELLDAERVTLRVGDERVLRKKSG